MQWHLHEVGNQVSRPKSSGPKSFLPNSVIDGMMMLNVGPHGSATSLAPMGCCLRIHQLDELCLHWHHFSGAVTVPSLRNSRQCPQFKGFRILHRGGQSVISRMSCERPACIRKTAVMGKEFRCLELSGKIRAGFSTVAWSQDTCRLLTSTCVLLNHGISSILFAKGSVHLIR